MIILCFRKFKLSLLHIIQETESDGLRVQGLGFDPFGCTLSANLIWSEVGVRSLKFSLLKGIAVYRSWLKLRDLGIGAWLWVQGLGSGLKGP